MQTKTDLENELIEQQRKFDIMNETNETTITNLKMALKEDRRAATEPTEELKLQIEDKDKELKDIRVEKTKYFEMLVKVRADLEKATAQVCLCARARICLLICAYMYACEVARRVYVHAGVSVCDCVFVCMYLCMCVYSYNCAMESFQIPTCSHVREKL